MSRPRKATNKKAAMLEESTNNEVLDLRKSNAAEKLCFWCGKRVSPTANGQEKDFCSEICFDQFRRDSFKKRSSCMWCNNVNQGTFNVNIMSTLDETKFCSEDCLTQFKLRLFCEETSSHLDKIKDGSLSVSLQGFPVPAPTELSAVAASPSGSTTGASSDGSLAQKDLITPDLWLKTAANLKTNPPLKASRPFQISDTPLSRRTSISSVSSPIPLVALSPDIEAMGDTSATNVRGVGFMSTSQDEIPQADYSNTLSWMLPSSASRGKPRTSAGRGRRGHSGGNPPRKRTKHNNGTTELQASSRNMGNNFTQQQFEKQVSKRSNSSTKRSSGQTGKRSQRRNQKVHETPAVSSGNGIPIGPTLFVTADVPYPSLAGSTGKMPYERRIITAPQTVTNNNDYNQVNLMGLELALGRQVGGFLPNVLQADDSSTESSSSSSGFNSQIISNIIQNESLGTASKYSNGTPTNLEKSHIYRANWTVAEAETQTEDSNSNSMFRNFSSLPPTTILVPFPFAVPIPFPIPIIINGAGLRNQSNQFSLLKEENVDELPLRVESETIISSISNQHPSNNDSTEISDRTVEPTEIESSSKMCALENTMEDDAEIRQETFGENVKMEEKEKN